MRKTHSLLILSFALFSFSYSQPTLGLLHTSDDAFLSYTLFSNNEETYLIDNCGLVVQQWHSDYRPGRAVYLLENGNLLRTAEQDGAFAISGRGGRVELFAWDGTLLWYYEINDASRQAHHDIEPLPNGNFLCLVWEKRSAEAAKEQGSDRDFELWTEAVYEVKILPDNQAEIVWQWQLWDHLVQEHDATKANYGAVADFPERIDLNYREAGSDPAANWAHLNSIDYHEGLDQIVLSSRLFSEVWVIDHSTTTAEATQSTGGRYKSGGDLLYRFGNPGAYQSAAPRALRFQHDAQWVDSEEEDSELMVFNNEEGEERSAIKSWQPPYLADGSYARNPEGDFVAVNAEVAYTAPSFYSAVMSSVQRLPNGHLFICAGTSGHFFEIDENQEVVWEYLNPVNPNGGPAAQGATVRFNQTFAARKYALDYPAFTGRTLTPGAPVEINPSPSDCFVPTPYTPEEPLALLLSQNPIEHFVHLRTNRTAPLPVACFDGLGRLLFQLEIDADGQLLDLSAYPAGMYVLYLEGSGQDFVVEQLVKL